MKKFIAYLLSLLLICTALTTASATTTVDLSQISGNTDLYEISVNSDSEVAFVTTTISVSNRSFTHKFENPNYYSCLESDLLIHDYFGSSPYAVMRTWIKYAATEYLYPTSVTFTIEDTDYTFSGIGNKSWSEEDGSGGTSEKMLIIYGDTTDYWSFITAMANWAEVLLNDDDSDDYEIAMTIHGTTDVETTLGWGPAYDFLFTVLGMADIGGKLEDSGSSASTLKVTEHK